MANNNTLIVGNPAAVLKSEEPFYSAETGYGLRQTWHGSKAAIVAKLSTYAQQGYNGTTSKSAGGSWQLVISLPDVAFDRWEIDTEWEQRSLFALPQADAEMSAYSNAGSTGRAAYKKMIEDAVSNGDNALSVTEGAYPYAYVIFRLMSRGVEAYEVRRPVIRRRRTVALQWATPITLDQNENVYTTAKLITTFAIPALVQLQLPANPAVTPIDCAWAWKTRTQASSSVPALNKTEEQTEWVFAAWPTKYYTLIS
jgi:hypothetical protein